METKFHQKLEGLRLHILNMAARAEHALKQSIEALNEQNTELAEAVIEGDLQINELELAIDQYTLELLAREQPVAVDLRFIVGVRRAVIDIERIADQAVNIAEKTMFLARQPIQHYDPNLQKLAEIAVTMLKLAIEAFSEANTEKASSVCLMDPEADSLNVRILKSVISNISNDNVVHAINTLLVARSLERIGDLSTNLAETTIFIVEGKNIKHHCQRE